MDREQRLAEVEDLVNPGGRMQDRELQTDAEPRFSGRGFLRALRKELDKEVEKLVADELPKDLSWFNARDIERYFAQGRGRAP